MEEAFKPLFNLTKTMTRNLLRIEATKTQIVDLPMTAAVLTGLRESARLFSTHYSTMIEGNKLNPEQIAAVITENKTFVGRERDAKEVAGYYQALTLVEKKAQSRTPLTEKFIQEIHSIVMSDGVEKTKPTPYRPVQNVIRDSRTGSIIYLPPEAHDVPLLMKNMVTWINEENELPCPIKAAIAHYQYATIHPYYDGNGRTARLLTTFILHANGYDLKGIYSLEEYYATNLPAYYEAISIGPSHNYYLGRAAADITLWVEYFIEGMAQSCEAVIQKMKELKSTAPTEQQLLRSLTPMQRKVLLIFHKSKIVTTQEIERKLKLNRRTILLYCKEWVANGFIEIVDPSNKNRSYQLTPAYEALLVAAL